MQKLFGLYKLALILFFFISAADGMAQQGITCSTPTPTGAARLVPPNFERPSGITGMRMIKLYIYVTKADNQYALPAQTEEEILAHFEIVRQQFAPHGICFIIAGIGEIVSDDMAYIDPDSQSDFAMIKQYANSRPDCFSVFIHNSIEGDVIGTAWGIPNNFVSLQGSYTWSGYPVLASHEIGHALGLFHTFEDYYGKELVARTGGCSNCSTAGDLICDTQADMDLPSSAFNNNCTYGGIRKDSCNNPYVMEPANAMSYNALIGCLGLQGFTAGQAERMHYTIGSTPTLLNVLLNSTSHTITNTINYSSGNYSFPYRNSLTVNSPSYVVTGPTWLQITSAEVIIKPGATFAPSTGRVVLRANVLCQ